MPGALTVKGSVPYNVPLTFGRKFELGQVVMTNSVANAVGSNDLFAQFVTSSLRRHAYGDWGDVSDEDKKENTFSLDKRLRLFSVYDPMKSPEAKYHRPELPKIWIITEADRSATSILFPRDY
jgi:hypothetical protein